MARTSCNRGGAQYIGRMSLRTRKLVGSIVLFTWMVVFALVAMAVIAMLPSRPHALIEMVMYAFLGVAWILPLKPLFIWMGKGQGAEVDPHRP